MLFQVNSLTKCLFFGAILLKRAMTGRLLSGSPVRMKPSCIAPFYLYHVQNQHMIQFAILALIILQLF